MKNKDHNNHSDLHSSAPDAFDLFLVKKLQENQSYIDDDGFAAGVIKSLPAATKLSLWQERLIILVPLLIISVLVLSQFSLIGVMIKLWTLLVGMEVNQLIQIGVAVSVAVISGACVWFARQLRII